MTLFIVALVLLLLVDRDQRRAVHALQLATAGPEPASPAEPAAPTTPAAPSADAEGAPTAEESAAAEPKPATAQAAAVGKEIAEVERGRIAALSGVIALIWLVILFLMIWYAG
jgi:hypothetical protein